MKVIFLEDVPRIAKAGEVRDVAEGYGRNFLIPQKLAAPVSPGVTSRFEAQQRARAKEQAQTAAAMAEMVGRLDGREIVIQARAGTKERLYGSITSADIAAELKKTTGVTVDKRKIELDKPIHELGSFEVTIRLARDVVPKIKVTVSMEEGDGAQ
ncbi:MAG: 50S ribosomal protein L9 [Dehalococcoidales bacterium]|nr:50S ribosomal protein L9 [Dehalococcoidales bacterium]